MNSEFITRLSGLLSGAAITLGIAFFMYWPSGLKHEPPPERPLPLGVVAQATPILPPAKTMVAILVEPMRVTPEQTACLEKNIFHEAGVESWRGKIGVGQVVVQRVSSNRWDSTICEVVYKRKQFSWTIDKKLRNEKPRGALWEASRKAARDIIAGVRLPELEGALFYHTDYIDPPKWASARYMLAQVDQHIFYFNDVKR